MTQSSRFDEQQALAELERLADKIQLSRRERARAVDEFDAFVRTFREERTRAGRGEHGDGVTDDLFEGVAELVAPRGGSAARAARGGFERPPAPRAPEPQPQSRPQPRAEKAVAAPAVTSIFDDDAVVPEAAPTPEIVVEAPDRTRTYVRAGLAALAAVVLILALVRVIRGPSSAPATPAPAAVAGPSSPTPAGAVATPAAPTASPSAAVTPAPAAAPPAAAAPAATPRRAITVELVTARPVWARVMADDRRVLERELPAGSTIPLGADRSLIVRAGDAGAIRLIVDGKDLGVLGADGKPITKTFTKP